MFWWLARKFYARYCLNNCSKMSSKYEYCLVILNWNATFLGWFLYIVFDALLEFLFSPVYTPNSCCSSKYFPNCYFLRFSSISISRKKCHNTKEKMSKMRKANKRHLSPGNKRFSSLRSRNILA